LSARFTLFGMQPYLDALNALHELLGALGEQHWRSWIARDISEWENSNSVSHHLSAYGGMGSLNDMSFEDIWLGTLFDDLRGVCYYFAHKPKSKPDLRALKSSLGRTGFELSGWRCLACGYGVLSDRDIEYFIARQVIRQRILEEAGRTRLREFVRTIIQSRPPDAESTKQSVADLLETSGLHVRRNNDWLRPCPNCGSNDTAVYRWLPDEGGDRLVPAHDNLPLRI
jgi:hypothetical protein